MWGRGTFQKINVKKPHIVTTVELIATVTPLVSHKMEKFLSTRDLPKERRQKARERNIGAEKWQTRRLNQVNKVNMTVTGQHQKLPLTEYHANRRS